MWTWIVSGSLIALSFLGAAWMWWPFVTKAQAKGQAEQIKQLEQHTARLEDAQAAEWTKNREQDEADAARIDDRADALDFLRNSFSRH